MQQLISLYALLSIYYCPVSDRHMKVYMLKLLNIGLSSHTQCCIVPYGLYYSFPMPKILVKTNDIAPNRGTKYMSIDTNVVT